MMKREGKFNARSDVTAKVIETLRAENERLREALDACNITSLIAHALSDGHIANAVSDKFETALNEMNAVLNHPRPEDQKATPPAS